jgi:hypothetical protein
MPHDVFISYASLDKSTAEAIYAALRAKGIACWMARVIPPGVSFPGALCEAVEASKVVILVFSPRANDSTWVLREIKVAADKNIPVIPFRIEAAPLSSDLRLLISHQQWLDALTPPLEDHFPQLIQGVERWLGPPAVFNPIAKPARAVPKRGDNITNSLGMNFAWVPPGKSFLGGGGGKPGRTPFTLDLGLWCGIYPVTQAEWELVMKNKPSHFKGNPRYPVESVSYDDVEKFLHELNQKQGGDGYSYRLPTAPEWEYICRGGPISEEQSKFDFYFAKSKGCNSPSATLLFAHIAESVQF